MKFQNIMPFVLKNPIQHDLEDGTGGPVQVVFSVAGGFGSGTTTTGRG
jgi:hypothetical protein